MNDCSTNHIARLQARVGIISAVGALLVAALGVWAATSTFGLRLVRMSYDTLLRWRGPLPVSDAAIIYLDDQSHEQLKQSYTAPWDRRLYDGR